MNAIMYESLMEWVLDDEVDCVRFHSPDKVAIVYKDGGVNFIVCKDGLRWHVQDNYRSLVE